MSTLPLKLYTAQAVRELDRIAINSIGIDGLELMSRAGQAAYRLTQQQWPQARHLIVLCGPGNNGGDGFIVAQRALDLGLEVDVYLLTSPDKLSPTATLAHNQLCAHDIQLRELDNKNIEHLLSSLDGDGHPGSTLLIDALFGTGLDRDIGDSLAYLFARINSHPVPVLALDIPSGLHADSGCLLGNALMAAVTISFIGLKQGMLTGVGTEVCGTIFFDDLQVPELVYSFVNATVERVDYDSYLVHDQQILAPRLPSVHKGNFGHVLVVGGAPGMTGAVYMAAEAAARAGAGLVSVATHPDQTLGVNVRRPEIMVHALTGNDHLGQCLKQASVVAVGPGLGQQDWGRECLAQVLDSLASKPIPLVIDADALNNLAEEGFYNDQWILTPHPGEAARLLGKSTAAVQADRYVAARDIQQRYGGICVLKGAGTIIQSGDMSFVCSAGNPGMASGGMGDVLTGIIAGFLAQGLSPLKAAVLGVCIHAEAGDLVAKEGQRGMLATDLFPFIRRLVNPG